MAEKQEPASLAWKQDFIKDIQVNLLECKICFKEFTGDCRPKNLLCGHVLCQECVAALAHPLLRKLECPFCRQLCSLDHTSNCLPLSDLQELLAGHGSRCAVDQERSPDRGPTPLLHLSAALGGWGILINPVGLAVLGSSEKIVIVHDRANRVAVLHPNGRMLHRFGPRGSAAGEIGYPLDVAVGPLGHVVVTDGGDRAVKVFTLSGSHVVTIKALFQLPWGVDVDSEGHILVSDALAGSLSSVTVDYSNDGNCLVRTMIPDLRNPKAVACCPRTGHVATVEHLSEGSGQHTRLKVFTKDFHIVYQNDSSNLSLLFNVCIHVTAVTFAADGDMIVSDDGRGMVWRLGTPRHPSAPVPMVSANLMRPVGLASLDSTLYVLDSGDHTLKVYDAV